MLSGRTSFPRSLPSKCLVGGAGIQRVYIVTAQGGQSGTEVESAYLAVKHSAGFAGRAASFFP